jgi:YD repeat-containing protein
LAATTDAKGQVKSFVYDDLDRIRHKFYGGTNTLPVASFRYDDTCQNGIGRLCSDVTANLPEQGFLGAATAYNYDARGRLISETKRIEETNYVTQFVYDAAGRQREITYPDGEKVAYTYNEAGQLASVSGNDTYLASAKYDLRGQPEEEVLGNQTKNVYTYEPQTHRLDTKTVKDKNGTDIWSQNLDYDPVGNITSINYPLENLINTYSYDDLNRLTKMTPSQGEVAAAYEYDRLGRMTLKQEEGGEEEPPECVAGKENPKLPGDLDCDCDVDIVDIMMVAVVWNTHTGDAKFKSEYDFDSDGRISIADVMFVAAKWNTRCGE